MSLTVVDFNASYPAQLSQEEQDADRSQWIEAIRASFPDADYVSVRFKKNKWLGRMYVKQVGDPPWKFPKALFETPRRTSKGNSMVRIGIGWRSTAYEAIFTIYRSTPKDDQP